MNTNGKSLAFAGAWRLHASFLRAVCTAQGFSFGYAGPGGSVGVTTGNYGYYGGGYYGGGYYGGGYPVLAPSRIYRRPSRPCLRAPTRDPGRPARLSLAPTSPPGLTYDTAIPATIPVGAGAERARRRRPARLNMHPMGSTTDQCPFLPLLLWMTIAAAASPSDFRAGAAAVVITPPAGIPMAGYYSERGAQGIHDDLYAKAIVIEQGARPRR